MTKVDYGMFPLGCVLYTVWAKLASWLTRIRYRRPGLLAEEVAQDSFRRTIKRPKNDHERSSQQGTSRKAQCMVIRPEPSIFDLAQSTSNSGPAMHFVPHRLTVPLVHRSAAFLSGKTTKLQSCGGPTKVVKGRSRPFTV